ncbi:uncharacterized protein [Amphiura filiformis]|uniref:uncharacterized protein n=1 Tax=Amphiura filiformis TaxID=82378 RepID=UPI003B2109E8
MKCKILRIVILVAQIIFVKGITESDLNHECLRTCEWPAKPKTCEYTFVIEWFYSMSKACYGCPFNLTECSRPDCIPLNGVPRPVAVVNRLFPGPSIQVCENDTIVAHVTNKMVSSEGVSIHWHGAHQRGTPYMDGTSMITQCPIPSFASFTYNFTAAPYGTHWWHSHAGMQRADGVFGALIFRQAAEADVNSHLYDYDLPEHVVLVHDWLDEMTMVKFASHHFDDGSNKPESILINGKGKREQVVDENGNTAYTAREVFKIDPNGSRYRFRFINNAITNCPLRVSVDSHKLTVIASDGASLEPYETDIFVIFGGERFDVVLNADQDVGNYWMRVKGLADCRFQQELAIVRYVGAPEEDPQEAEILVPEGVVLNPWNEAASDTAIPIVNLNATDPDDETSKEEADLIYYIGMDFNKVNNYHFHHPEHYPIEEIDRSHHLYSPQLNHVSFTFNSRPPLTQSKELSEEDFCTPDTIKNYPKNCSAEYCECTHIVNAQLGQVVELVVVDEGVTFDASHPMHLHGQYFRVVALEKLDRSTSVEQVMAMDKAGMIKRKLSSAVLKDTVIVPDGGFTAIRFLADNPGWWFFHCHLEFHVSIGMSLIVHVGDEEDLPPIPDNFPRCGPWPGKYSKAPCDTSPPRPGKTRKRNPGPTSQ